MPCFNAAAHLPSSVGSVLNQTFADWEILAVDDGSKDGTLEWLQGQTDRRIRWIHEANGGVSRARNAGIAAARGRRIAFLDADDTWAPEYLERMCQALDRNPGAVLVYCGWQNVGLSGSRGRPYVSADFEVTDKREQLFASCRWPIHAALVQREAVVAAGGFDTSLKNAEDYAFWLAVAATAPIVLVPEVMAYYHFHGGEQASQHTARAALQFLRAQNAYLETHPDFARSLGRKRLRTLTVGALIERGYECYWSNDLIGSREIFRAVMGHSYGTLSDWKYMLPALLPPPLHRLLVDRLRAQRRPLT